VVQHYIVQPASGPLSGTVAAPGDKSLGHRAVSFGSLCNGAVEVRGLGSGADNRGTARAMAQMGVPMRESGGALVIDGVGLRGLSAPSGSVDCGNSGTTMRLLCGLLAAQSFESVLVGDASLSKRPMRRVVDPLHRMGAHIDGERAPLSIHPPPSGLRGIDYALPVASAQIKSALLIAALYADGATRVAEPGPSRDHTERMLRYLGVPVISEADRVTVLDPISFAGELEAAPIEVPGDPSSAAFVVAAALLVGARDVRVGRVCVNPTRTGFLDALSAMGAQVVLDRREESCGEQVSDLVVSSSAPALLGSTTIGGDLIVRSIDEVPILAVLAATADGATWFRDAGELRVKESDRIATTAAMLRAFGVEVDEEQDAFCVHGRAGAPLSAGHVDAAGDHRIAMAATVAALIADGPSRIDDVANVATSFPGFVEAMGSLGASIEAGE